MADERDPMFGVINTLETEIGIASGFFERLLQDGDDWSFVIKLHALAEAALTHLLTTAVGREELSDLFGSLPMADSRRGKLGIAIRLHLLAPRQVAFLQALGTIRNKFAHDVKHVGLRIEEYVRSLTPADQDRFWDALIRGYSIEPAIIDFDGRSVPSREFARARPRFTIWVAAMTMLSLIYRAAALDEEQRKKFVDVLSTMKPLRSDLSRK